MMGTTLKQRAVRQGNPCAKTRKKENPYEVWRGNLNLEPNEAKDSCEWRVLKKWQSDDSKPFARWFCFVVSPYCPDGEYGDTYVTDVKRSAYKVSVAVNEAETFPNIVGV